MVGHRPLEASILVRIQVPQPIGFVQIFDLVTKPSLGVAEYNRLDFSSLREAKYNWLSRSSSVEP